MTIQGKPMIKHVLSTLNHQMNEVVIVLNDENRVGQYSEFISQDDYDYNLIFVEDKIKNKGPMSGIMTGLSHISGEWSLVLPCDSPYVSPDYIKSIFCEIDDDYSAIVPCHDEKNRLMTSEPLHSVYRKTLIGEIENLIGEDVLHIKGLIEKIETKFVLIDNKKIEKKEFRNLNSPEDI